MRKRLHEAQEIDQYLLQEMTPAERLVFQARMLAAPDLKETVALQSRAHRIIRWFARSEKRQQLETIYERLMQDDRFNLELNNIFK